MVKRVLDEATKRALVGAAPISSQATISFTPELYGAIKIAPAFIPIFKIRGLTVDEGAELDSLIKESQNKSIDNWNEKAYSFTRRIIVGWENVFDAGSGEEIGFIADASGACDASNFVGLSVNVKAELFSQVMKMRGLVGVSKLGL
jgi:hypothetical protein